MCKFQNEPLFSWGRRLGTQRIFSTKPVREPGIKSNDRMELHGIILIKLQVSHLKEASGVMGKLFSSI
jgi:hypothetical protein